MTHPPYWCPKGLIEHLCQQQAYAPDQHSKHVIQLALNMLATHRPVGPDGKHGDRHTPTCDCADTDDETTEPTRLRDYWVSGPGAATIRWGSGQQFETHELAVDDEPVGVTWGSQQETLDEGTAVWYGEAEPTLGVVKGDLWMLPDGRTYRWNGRDWGVPS